MVQQELDDVGVAVKGGQMEDGPAGVGVAVVETQSIELVGHKGRGDVRAHGCDSSLLAGNAVAWASRVLIQSRFGILHEHSDGVLIADGSRKLER